MIDEQLTVTVVANEHVLLAALVSGELDEDDSKSDEDVLFVPPNETLLDVLKPVVEEVEFPTPVMEELEETIEELFVAAPPLASELEPETLELVKPDVEFPVAEEVSLVEVPGEEVVRLVVKLEFADFVIVTVTGGLQEVVRLEVVTSPELVIED